MRLTYFGGNKAVYCTVGKPDGIYTIDQMSLADAYKHNKYYSDISFLCNSSDQKHLEHILYFLWNFSHIVFYLKR